MPKLATLKRKSPSSSSFLSSTPTAEVQSNEGISGRKGTKSRDGCVTCKRRRLKCDEGKPTCRQCTHRGVTCGGYRKLLTWMVFDQSNIGGSRGEFASRRPRLRPAIPTIPAGSPLTNDVVRNDGRATEPELPDGASPSETIQEDDGVLGLRFTTRTASQVAPEHVETLPIHVVMPLSFEPNHQTITAPGGILESASASTNPQSTIADEIRRFQALPPVVDDLHDAASNLSSGVVNQHRLLSISAADTLPYEFSQLDDLLLQTDGSVLEMNHDNEWNISGIDEFLESAEVVLKEDVGNIGWQIAPFEGHIESASEPLGSFSSSLNSLDDSGGFQKIYQQPQSSSATPEMIRHLFEQQTCAILSIKDDETKNPWRTFVWPLASRCSALYHALAAMTCLHMCRTQSQLRVVGLRHFQSGEQALINNEDNGNMLLETAIATRLALGFAETWDHQRSSTGIDHINRAKALIRQAAARQQTSKLSAQDVSRLSFLANTCLYMDVIARLVCVAPQSFNDTEFMTVCTSLSSAVPSERQLDPLMGCAITLFPLIGRLGELVGRGRKRTGKRNSLAIISQATELRMEIEGWDPLIDSGAGVELNPSVTNSIQTAEAYRWASLLLLRQTVPELPWVHSMWELASKCLVFLATIPLSSRMIIVHIFPLLVAGCEAFEEDDRDWVLERWDLMSKRMITGIVDRCKEITIEVWRRRDEYESRHGTVYEKSPSGPPPTAAGLTHRDGSPIHAKASASLSATEITTRFDMDARSRSEPSDFPESAAFKKGIDPVTRAGFIDYTVRGELHWLTVMKDWNWEVMLG